MNNRQTLIRLITAAFILALVAVVSITVTAGTLEPTDSPAPTMHTLSEIYSKIRMLLPESWREMPEASQVENAVAIHMDLVGENQGHIDGSCTAAGKEDTIVIVGNEHNIAAVLDPQSGNPTGNFTVEPYTVIKYLDKSSPKLYQALCTGEQMTGVEIKFYRKDTQGAEEQYYTVLLTNAIIVDIKEFTPNLESVSFNFRTIRWTWEPDGIEYQYDTFIH